MSRNEKSPPRDISAVLCFQSLTEFLSQYVLIDSRNYPDGEWSFSEEKHPRQFRGAFCVPNQLGQSVAAPMSSVNVSAATTEEEVLQYCTVYQFDPSFQRRCNTEQSDTANQTGSQQQHHARGMPPTGGNSQQLPRPVQFDIQYRVDSGNKHRFMTQDELTFSPSPPSYESTTASYPYLHASGSHKEIMLPPAPAQDQNNFVSFSDASINEWPSHQHQQPTVNMASFVSSSFTEPFQHSPVSNQIHGLESFRLQDLNTDIHGSVIIPSDSFGDQFTPPTLTRLEFDEQALNVAYGQTNNSGMESNERKQNQTDEHDEHGSAYSPKMPK